MSDVERWKHPRDAAAEAVVYALIEDVAKERKEEARQWVANHLREDSSKGFDAVAKGKVIGSVTRSKDSEKLDILDMAAFVEYAVSHQPHLISVAYQEKDSFLRTLKQVDGTWIDREGVPVPGVSKRISYGTVRVNKDPDARELVRTLLSSGAVSLEGLKELNPPGPEPTDRYTQDREAGAL
jgi:hypothetical protein